MKKLDVPKIEPIDEKVFTFNQSKYDMAPKLPFRTLVVGASAGGKTVLISNLLLNIYRNSFERIFVFSPSILIDQNWEAVRKYIKKDLKVDTEKERVFLRSMTQKHYKTLSILNTRSLSMKRKTNLENYIQYVLSLMIWQKIKNL